MLTSVAYQGPAEIFPGFVLVPNGGLVHYVHSSGAAALDLLPVGMNSPTPGGFFTSIALALASCRANRGDQVIALPGHVETIATADAWASLPAGVSIRGLGEPESDQRPTLNFTATGSTVLMDQAGTVIDNFIIDCCKTAATTVAAPFTVSAAGCKFTRNKVHTITSATQLATIPLTVASGADDCLIADNYIWATGAGTFATNPTNNIKITAAVANLRIMRNDIYGGTAAATGLIEASAAPTNVRIVANHLNNMFATGTSVIVLIANSTGVVAYNSLSVTNNGTAANQGITVPGAVRCFQNFCSDEDGKSGVITPGVAS
jgi:hypothetical protein